MPGADPDKQSEPQMHDLQIRFASAHGEQDWEAGIRSLFAAGDLSAVADIVEPALVALGSEFGAAALATRPEDVVLSGWEDLVEAIAVHEGDPITGVAMALANEADRAFEKGQSHHPYMMLGLYCDEPFAFSRASAADLIEQTAAEDGPAWAGYDEDIEVYLDLEGIDHLNTLLLHHKQRHFFRDDNPDHAPLRYVEYVLGCWWRALLFHQAVAAECAMHGLPGGIPVVAGMVDMRPEIIVVHGMGAGTRKAERLDAKPLASIIASDFIQVKAVEEIEELTGSDLRRRVAETAQDDNPPQEKRGFLARLFGRRASR